MTTCSLRTQPSASTWRTLSVSDAAIRGVGNAVAVGVRTADFAQGAGRHPAEHRVRIRLGPPHAETGATGFEVVVGFLNNQPDVTLDVWGHTDWVGGVPQNQKLSELARRPRWWNSSTGAASAAPPDLGRGLRRGQAGRPEYD